MMQNSVCMKTFYKVTLVLFLAAMPFWGTAQNAIQLPAGWYPNFPIVNWLETRTNVIQELNNQSIPYTRNVADELIWNSTVTNFPTETDLLFNQSNQLERITVYIQELTDANVRHAQWFTLFSNEYGNDYIEENTSEIHKYKWPNENGIRVELTLFRQFPNFAIRAEFLKN